MCETEATYVCKLVINGGNPLNGEITVQGCKNAALPIMAAALLTKEKCVIHNCPDISDVSAGAEILRHLGAKVNFDRNTAEITADNINESAISKELMEKMRSSVMFLGSILARNKKAVICSPGGCDLGERPIDIHLKSFARLGVDIYTKGDCVLCNVDDNIKSDDIILLYPSVGATENIMIFTAGLENTVRIYNAAKEPEIVDLQNFLNLMGADIRGGGTEVITVYPSKGLHGCEYRVMADRIVASTYACAAAACGGELFLKDAEPKHMKALLGILSEMGCEVIDTNRLAETSGVKIISDGRCKNITMIKTAPYPGLPTDVQPLLCSVLINALGKSELCETVFKNRFAYVKQLEKLGANIQTDGNSLRIYGAERLNGCSMSATDLRGGAAMVTAALAAQGTSVIDNVHYISRGYEDIVRDLKAAGGDIRCI